MSQLPPVHIEPMTAPDLDVLVAVDHDDGTAAIVRDSREDGTLWLCGRVGDEATQLQGCLPATEPLTGDRTVQGGRLPAPAVGAEVVDDAGRRWQAATGEGVWLVVVDQPLGFGLGMPVRYLDAAGGTVARPSPPTWSRTPVDDAPEPCPACAGTGWDHVRPHDAAGRGTRASVVCRECGHEEAIGTALATSAPLEPRTAPRPRLPRGLDGLAVYAAAGLPSRLAGWVGDGRRVQAISLDHGPGPALTVETRHEFDERTRDQVVVCQALGDALRADEPWPQRSPAGLAVWLRTRDRALRQIAARAPLVTRLLLVDGRPEPFLVASAGQAWAAVRRHGDLLIVLTASGVRPEDVVLEPLADPLAALSL